MSEQPIGVEDPILDDQALEALATACATAPPPELRARVLGAARAEAASAAAVRAARRWRLVGAAAAVVALGLAGLLANVSQLAGVRARQIEELSASNAALAARLDIQAGELAAVRAAVESQAGVLRIVTSPRTLVASLGPQPGVKGSGRMVVDATSGEAALLVAGLDPAPPGKTYELWAVRGTRPPEPAGLFAMGVGGWAATRMPVLTAVGEITAFAVSLEPAGGSAAPTGPIVLTGALTG
jgi:anti-sigma-K factor RskA